MTAHRAFSAAAAAILFSILVVACSEPTEPVDLFPDAPYEVVTCAGLRVPASASPVERVSIGTLPASFVGDVYARVETTDPTVFGYAVVVADGSSVELLAPVHPSGSREGGDVTLWVTDGNQSCAPAPLTLQPILASPGELSSVVDLIQGIVDQQAAVLELSRDDLTGTALIDQPTSALPLAILQGVLDHPDNPGSLTAAASGASAGMDAARLELIDALLASTGLRAALEEATAAAGPPAMESAMSQAPSRVSALACLPDVVENAAQLDSCMEAAASATFELGGASGEVLEDLGSLFAATGVVPQLAVVSGVLGLASWVALNDKLKTAALMPSRLTALDYEMAPLEFREDEAGTGSYSSIMLTAENLGWDFGIEFLKGLLAAAGAVSGFDRADLGGVAVNSIALALATGPGVGALLGESTVEEFQLQPETFGPVDIGSADWSTTSVMTGTSVVLVSQTDYEPRAPGWTTLVLRTRTGEFAGQSIAEEEQVFVTDLQLSILPDETFLQPSQVDTFVVTVAESEHPDSVVIDPDVVLKGSATITYNGDGTHTVIYTAPDDPDDGSVDLLTVRHTANSGARAFAPGYVTDIATIRFGRLQLVPVVGCVSPSQEIQLEVMPTGIEPEPALVWTSSAGDVTDSGLFTAPGEAGDVTITVALADDPDVQDSITVSVGGCTCSYSLQMGGNATYVGQPGDEVSYFSVDELVPGEANAVASIAFRNQAGFGVTVTVEIPTVVITGPGDYPVSTIGGGLGYGDPEFFSDTDPSQGTLRIFEYEPHTKLTGEVVGGTVEDAFDPDGTVYPFSAGFQIYPPEGSLGWNYTCVVPEPVGG